MNLYIYDHCPYCVRAQMMANYKEIPHKTIFLANDDEKTCYDLIGKKMVPILQFDDGSAMGESLDIVKIFDERGNTNRVFLSEIENKDNISLLEAEHKTINTLLFPRNIELNLPEFSTMEAREYFRKKKEASLGMTFSQALEQTKNCREKIEKCLHALSPLFLEKEKLKMDDVLLYPTLRNLSMVKGLLFPTHVREYVDHISHLTDINTYFDRAI